MSLSGTNAPPPAMSATGIGSWAIGSPGHRDLVWLAWASVAGLSAATAVGVLGGSLPMVVIGGTLTLALIGVMVPEASLALLVMIGAIKAAPWLAFMPVDPTVLAALAVLAAIAARSYTHGIPLLPLSAALPALLGVLVLVSVFWSPSPYTGFFKAVRFEGLTLLAFFAPLVVVRTHQHFGRLMLAIAALALLTLLTAESTGDPLKPLTVAGGNDTNQIDLALSCVMGLGAVGYCALSVSGPARWLSAVLGLGFALALFAAGSRGVLVGGVIAIVYAGVALAGRRQRTRTLVGAVLLVLVVLGAGPRLFGEAATRYQEVLVSGDSSVILGQREYILSKSLDIAVDNPMGLGSGAYPGVTGINYPHNIELELVDEYGLLALAIFLCALAGAWLRRRYALKLGWKRESAIVGALVVALFFDAQLSHGLNESRSLWLALGLAYALPQLRRTA